MPSQVISWPPHPDGGAPVSSYTLFYRREFGSWQRKEVDNNIIIVNYLNLNKSKVKYVNMDLMYRLEI